jgi:protein involved in polysaccharide export with SLBB domain
LSEPKRMCEYMRRTHLLAAVLAFTAFGVTIAAKSQQMSVANDQTVQSHPHLEQRYPRYIIQRQDVLQLTFPLTPEINQTVAVQPDGYINLQNGRGVQAQGLSVPELADAIKTAYAGTLHDPIVNVDLKDFQKPFFTVSGGKTGPV